MGLRISAGVLLCATAIALLAALGCTEKVPLPTEVGGPPEPPPVFLTPDSIQAIFTSRCINCHAGSAPAGGMNLSADSSYKYTVNVPSHACANLDRIEPSDPNNSCLVKRIEGTVTPRMPLGGILSPGQITMIRNWIAQGAPGTIAGPAL
jgi:hypothetical protein